MKNVYKKNVALFLLGVVLLMNVSANKSNWAGANLSSDDINNSVHFQLVRGSTCVGEFDKLRPVLDKFISQKIDASYLNNILGDPNKSISAHKQTQQHYHLTANASNCNLKLIIYKGNLVSYTVENCR